MYKFHLLAPHIIRERKERQHGSIVSTENHAEIQRQYCTGGTPEKPIQTTRTCPNQSQHPYGRGCKHPFRILQKHQTKSKTTHLNEAGREKRHSPPAPSLCTKQRRALININTSTKKHTNMDVHMHITLPSLQGPAPKHIPIHDTC